jgi:hypothetical protein
MFQMYDPRRMLVRWAVFDAIRLARRNIRQWLDGEPYPSREILETRTTPFYGLAGSSRRLA